MGVPGGCRNGRERVEEVRSKLEREAPDRQIAADDDVRRRDARLEEMRQRSVSRVGTEKSGASGIKRSEYITGLDIKPTIFQGGDAIVRRQGIL